MSLARRTSARRPRRALAVVGSSLALAVAAGSGVAAANGPDKDAKPVSPGASVQALGSYSRVVGVNNTVPAGGFSSATVSCPAGQRVFGGGASNSAFGTVLLTDSWPTSTTTWLVYVKNTATTSATFTVYALCGS